VLVHDIWEAFSEGVPSQSLDLCAPGIIEGEVPPTKRRCLDTPLGSQYLQTASVRKTEEVFGL
jgi:hypothetical protein